MLPEACSTSCLPISATQPRPSVPPVAPAHTPGPLPSPLSLTGHWAGGAFDVHSESDHFSHLRHCHLAQATTVSHLSHCARPAVVPASTLSFSLTVPSTAAMPDHSISLLKTLRFWLRKKAKGLTWTQNARRIWPVRPSPLSRGSPSPPAHSFQASRVSLTFLKHGQSHSRLECPSPDPPWAASSPRSNLTFSARPPWSTLLNKETRPRLQSTPPRLVPGTRDGAQAPSASSGRVNSRIGHLLVEDLLHARHWELSTEQDNMVPVSLEFTI